MGAMHADLPGRPCVGRGGKACDGLLVFIRALARTPIPHACHSNPPCLLPPFRPCPLVQSRGPLSPTSPSVAPSSPSFRSGKYANSLARIQAAMATAAAPSEAAAAPSAAPSTAAGSASATPSKAAGSASAATAALRASFSGSSPIRGGVPTTSAITAAAAASPSGSASLASAMANLGNAMAQLKSGQPAAVASRDSPGGGFASASASASISIPGGSEPAPSASGTRASPGPLRQLSLSSQQHPGAPSLAVRSASWAPSAPDGSPQRGLARRVSEATTASHDSSPMQGLAMRVSDTSTSSPATRLMREAAAAVTVSSARSSSPSAAAVEGLRALGGAATAAAAEGQQQQQAAPSASAFSISAAAGFGSGQAADGLLSSLAVPRISVRASSATQLLQAHTIATGLPPRSPGGKALLQGNFFQRISSALPPEGGGGGNVSRLHSTSTTSATGGLPFPASAPQHQSNAATSGMRGSSSPTHSSRSSPLSNTAQLRASLASASATAAVSSGSVRRSSGSGVGGGGGGGGTTLRRSFSLQAEMDAAASDGPSLRRPSVPTLPSSALLVATGSRAKRVSSTGQVPDHSILRQVPAAVPPSTSLPTGDAAATVSALMARTLALPELAGGNGPASAPTSPARGGASGSIMIAQPSPSRRVSIASSGGGSSQGRLGDHYGTLTALRNSQFPSSLGSYPDDGSALMANEDAASVAAASGGGGEAASPPTRLRVHV